MDAWLRDNAAAAARARVAQTSGWVRDADDRGWGVLRAERSCDPPGRGSELSAHCSNAATGPLIEGFQQALVQQKRLVVERSRGSVQVLLAMFT